MASANLLDSGRWLPLRGSQPVVRYSNATRVLPLSTPTTTLFQRFQNLFSCSQIRCGEPFGELVVDGT
jgi:hypothetical protein